jgi:hypothetical protein
MMIAYLPDGTQGKFAHPVDYHAALSAGWLQNPPGTKISKKKAEPEGEKVSGIEAIGAVVEDEKPVALAEAKQKDKVNNIHRK